MHVNACMLDAMASISFAASDGSRCASTDTARFNRTRGPRLRDLGDSTSAFSGADRATPESRVFDVADRFLAAIEGAGPGHLPATLEALRKGLAVGSIDELWR